MKCLAIVTLLLALEATHCLPSLLGGAPGASSGHGFGLGLSASKQDGIVLHQTDSRNNHFRSSAEQNSATSTSTQGRNGGSQTDSQSRKTQEREYNSSVKNSRQVGVLGPGLLSAKHTETSSGDNRNTETEYQRDHSRTYEEGQRGSEEYRRERELTDETEKRRENKDSYSQTNTDELGLGSGGLTRSHNGFSSSQNSQSVQEAHRSQRSEDEYARNRENAIQGKSSSSTSDVSEDFSEQKRQSSYNDHSQINGQQGGLTGGTEGSGQYNIDRILGNVGLGQLSGVHRGPIELASVNRVPAHRAAFILNGNNNYASHAGTYSESGIDVENNGNYGSTNDYVRNQGSNGNYINRVGLNNEQYASGHHRGVNGQYLNEPAYNPAQFTSLTGKQLQGSNFDEHIFLNQGIDLQNHRVRNAHYVSETGNQGDSGNYAGNGYHNSNTGEYNANNRNYRLNSGQIQGANSGFPIIQGDVATAYRYEQNHGQRVHENYGNQDLAPESDTPIHTAGNEFQNTGTDEYIHGLNINNYANKIIMRKPNTHYVNRHGNQGVNPEFIFIGGPNYRNALSDFDRVTPIHYIPDTTGNNGPRYYDTVSGRYINIADHAAAGSRMISPASNDEGLESPLGHNINDNVHIYNSGNGVPVLKTELKRIPNDLITGLPETLRNAIYSITKESTINPHTNYKTGGSYIPGPGPATNVGTGPVSLQQSGESNTGNGAPLQPGTVTPSNGGVPLQPDGTVTPGYGDILGKTVIIDKVKDAKKDSTGAIIYKPLGYKYPDSNSADKNDKAFNVTDAISGLKNDNTNSPNRGITTTKQPFGIDKGITTTSTEGYNKVDDKTTDKSINKDDDTVSDTIIVIGNFTDADDTDDWLYETTTIINDDGSNSNKSANIDNATDSYDDNTTSVTDKDLGSKSDKGTYSDANDGTSKVNKTAIVDSILGTTTDDETHKSSVTEDDGSKSNTNDTSIDDSYIESNSSVNDDSNNDKNNDTNSNKASNKNFTEIASDDDTIKDSTDEDEIVATTDKIYSKSGATDESNKTKNTHKLKDTHPKTTKSSDKSRPVDESNTSKQNYTNTNSEIKEHYVHTTVNQSHIHKSNGHDYFDSGATDESGKTKDIHKLTHQTVKNNHSDKSKSTEDHTKLNKSTDTTKSGNVSHTSGKDIINENKKPESHDSSKSASIHKSDSKHHDKDSNRAKPSDKRRPVDESNTSKQNYINKNSEIKEHYVHTTVNQTHIHKSNGHDYFDSGATDESGKTKDIHKLTHQTVTNNHSDKSKSTEDHTKLNKSTDTTKSGNVSHTSGEDIINENTKPESHDSSKSASIHKSDSKHHDKDSKRAKPSDKRRPVDESNTSKQNYTYTNSEIKEHSSHTTVNRSHIHKSNRHDYSNSNATDESYKTKHILKSNHITEKNNHSDKSKSTEAHTTLNKSTVTTKSGNVNHTSGKDIINENTKPESHDFSKSASIHKSDSKHHDKHLKRVNTSDIKSVVVTHTSGKNDFNKDTRSESQKTSNSGADGALRLTKSDNSMSCDGNDTSDESDALKNKSHNCSKSLEVPDISAKSTKTDDQSKSKKSSNESSNIDSASGKSCGDLDSNAVSNSTSTPDRESTSDENDSSTSAPSSDNENSEVKETKNRQESSQYSITDNRSESEDEKSSTSSDGKTEYEKNTEQNEDIEKEQNFEYKEELNDKNGRSEKARKKSATENSSKGKTSNYTKFDDKNGNTETRLNSSSSEQHNAQESSSGCSKSEDANGNRSESHDSSSKVSSSSNKTSSTVVVSKS